MFPESPIIGQRHNNKIWNGEAWTKTVDKNFKASSLKINNEWSIKNRLEKYSFNNHGAKTVLLLIPHYSETLINESEVVGRFYFKNGSRTEENHIEVFDITSKTAYNNTQKNINFLISGQWAWEFATCSYNSNIWLCVQTDDIKKGMLEFWGKRTCSSHLGYDPNDQFKIVSYYKSGIINSEINSSLSIL